MFQTLVDVRDGGAEDHEENEAEADEKTLAWSRIFENSSKPVAHIPERSRRLALVDVRDGGAEDDEENEAEDDREVLGELVARRPELLPACEEGLYTGVPRL